MVRINNNYSLEQTITNVASAQQFTLQVYNNTCRDCMAIHYASTQ